MSQENTTTTPEVPQITAGDLATVVNIIDAGSVRGAWKGEELAVVGNLRNKFAAIVKSVTPAVEPEKTEDTPAENNA